MSEGLTLLYAFPDDAPTRSCHCQALVVQGEARLARQLRLDFRNRFHMRTDPELGKVSNPPYALILASLLLCRCVDFAPDLALGAGGTPAAGAAGANAIGGADGTSDAGSASDAGSGLGRGGEGGSAGERAGAAEAGSTAEAGSAGDAGGTAEAGSAGSAGEAGDGGSAGGSAPLVPIALQRSLIETNPDALAYFNLERALEGATGELGAYVYRAYVLSFAVRTEEQEFPGPRCDDQQASSDGLSSLNGFSMPCPAEAENLYWQLPAWKPLAATNRFDLAPAGGENCGEQHLSFFFDTSWAGQPDFPRRAYLSFAAVIANPAPERGLEGCRPLLDFWASLSKSDYDSPDRRARALEFAFLGSSTAASSTPVARELDALVSRGFQPLLSPAHFAHVGRLQLLYLGDRGVWHFFEHALVSGKEGFVERRPLSQTLPVPALLDDHPKREQCIEALISSVPGLLSEDVNLLRVDIPPACFAATNSTAEAPLAEGLISAPLGEDLRVRLDQHLQHSYPDLGMSAWDLAKRAHFAGTCSGCHALGDSPWSNPSSVAHISQDFMRACASTGPDATRRCYARSPLVNTIFAPHWLSVLDEFLRHPGAYGPLPSGLPSTVAVDGAPWLRPQP